MSSQRRIMELADIAQAERTWDAYVHRAVPMTPAQIQMRREEALRIHFWAHPKMDCRNPELAAARNWTPSMSL